MGLPPELQAALLDRRMVFLRGRLDDALSNSVIAQLLLASQLAKDPRLIELYVDSPAGSLTSAVALYDVLQTLGPPVSTKATGTVGGAAVLVLAAGAPGQRFALPHARIHLCDDSVDVSAWASDPAALAEEARRATARWRAALIRHTAQDPAQLAKDLAASRWFTAPEAQTYGLIDLVAHT